MLLAVILLMAATSADPRPGPYPPRSYACAQARTEIVIDGRLNDSAWARAPWTDDFVDIEAQRDVTPRYRTRARMLWDDTHFYVAAEMEEPDLWATLRKRDSVIYYDNDFEVFLDPDGDSHLYTEIEVNALNTVWDLLLVKPYRDGGPAIHAWDIPGLQTAVALDGTLNDPSDRDRSWSVEIAIPWESLNRGPPSPGDEWRANFSRVDWHMEVREGRYGKVLAPDGDEPVDEENWVWSPQGAVDMHIPERWGVLRFMGEELER